MPTIRVLLAAKAVELRAVVADALIGQPDLAVIRDVGDEVEVLLHAEQADVVIVGMSGSTLPGVVERLVDEYPRIGVLALDIERGRGLLYQLRPQLDQITGLTPGELTAAIRQAASGMAA